MMKKLNLLWMGILALPMALAIQTDETSFAQEIYAGLLRFFSGSLTPLITLAFMIIAVLILILFGFLIKAIFSKLSKMAG
jgi:hypothetical protein